METVKVKPWGEGQGDYVLIDAADYDESKHEKYEDEPKPKRSKKEPKE